ncbi:nitric oxide reductase transcriptional regulator NorR [Cobetia amphilecti]|uniref:Nitric oxide reductase transcriptional regulator NorR n=1 Tax=Cobetia amphilecti TaxID=1055104 RepID=A0ABT6UQS2_9GAMM|nr:nitric oxide reductase transcriptional regulator NorR [Cobetia amphilecti]MDI5885056.1 nitric oxide reductase transcriptional regulator NorR [Cobetia amphilecti]
MPDARLPLNDTPVAAVNAWLAAWLSREEGGERRALPWTRLLAAIMQQLPGEAATLMRYLPERDELLPLATYGLPAEVRGRRFALAEHPRLKAIVEHAGVHRFALDSDLPDPFDGLLGDVHGPDLLVHDCAGIALREGDTLLGVMTFDALTPGVLAPLESLCAFAGTDELALPFQELQAWLSLPAHCLSLSLRQEWAAGATVGRSGLSAPMVVSPTGMASQSAMACPQRGPAMARLEAQLEAVADTEMTVLVQGETGVGKEGVVQRLHDASRRAARPLVRINCAALSPDLVESALFGHRRGAFSGATHDHRGHFVMADGGTLLLDEIGELPLALQPKLLRVLQEGELQPLGSDRVVQVDVRVIAATNRDLEAEVAAGHFREDLYHRLSVYPLRVPPLRERGRADLLALAGTFLEHNRTRLGLGNLRLTPAAERLLCEYPWPGNVRELEHCLSRAALHARLAHGAHPTRLRADGRQLVVITPDLLGLEANAEVSLERAASVAQEIQGAQVGRVDQAGRASQAAEASQTGEGSSAPRTAWQDGDETLGLRDATEAFQREHISRVWQASDRNWAEAARRLKVDRGNLYRQAQRLGIV